MQAELFYLHLRNFIKNHGIHEHLSSRLRKLKCEVKELETAIDCHLPKEEIVKEAADCAIICFHIMLILGAIPLWSMYLKLCEVAKRPHYQEMAKKVQEKEVLNAEPRDKKADSP